MFACACEKGDDKKSGRDGWLCVQTCMDGALPAHWAELLPNQVVIHRCGTAEAPIVKVTMGLKGPDFINRMTPQDNALVVVFTKRSMD